MLNFNQSFRPNTHFGVGTINKIESIANEYTKVLLVYGGESLKATGTHEKIIKQLTNVEVIEFAGITANPRLSDVRRAINVAKENNVDLIIAAGGGSVVDAAKAIAVGTKLEEDIWNAYSAKATMTEAIDILTVITNVATGSEANDISVLVNDELNLKRSIKTTLIYPKYAIMDPELTLTVGEYTTRYGLIDAFSHMMEQYFNPTDNHIIDRYIAGLMIDIVELAPKLLADLSNVELREQHMLLAYLAYNCDIRNMVGGDFACHGLDYGLASEFNTTHGAGLGIIMPNWMSYVAVHKPEKIVKFGREVFNLSGSDSEVAEMSSISLRTWLDSLNAAKTYSDLNVIIDTEALDQMVEKAKVSYPLGNYYGLDQDAIRKIFEMGL